MIQIKEITLKIKELNLNIENLEFNQLTLLTGTNGIGKSFINKTSFALVVITKALLDNPIASSEKAQLILENTFDDMNFTGIMSAIFSDGLKLTVEFQEGQVYAAYLGIIPAETKMSNYNAMYLSTKTRLFSDFKIYFALRDSIIKEIDLDNEAAEKLLKTYKLYDLMRFEQIINICKNTFEFNPTSIETFFEKEPRPKSITFDFPKREFNVEFTDGTTKNAYTLSNGEQALLNMQILI